MYGNYFKKRTNKWLAEQLEERGVSAFKLARILDCSPSQVYNWLNSSRNEPIPLPTLTKIAKLLAPTELNYLLNLRAIEDLDQDITHRIQKFAELVGLNHSQYLMLNSGLNEFVQDLSSQHSYLGRNGQTQLHIDYLTALDWVITLAQQVIEQAHTQPLVSPGNITLHLQYPYNHLVGKLLNLCLELSDTKTGSSNLRQFRAAVLNNLRQNLERPRNTQTQQWIFHHSLYLLGQYGDPFDRARLTEELRTNPDLPHISGSVGLLLSTEQGEFLEKYLIELQKDQELIIRHLEFDAIHYGDLEIGRQLHFSQINLSRTINEILRHLEQPKEYYSIQDIERYKLLFLLKQLGPGPFRQPSVVQRLETLLKGDAERQPLAYSRLHRKFNFIFCCLVYGNYGWTQLAFL